MSHYVQPSAMQTESNQRKASETDTDREESPPEEFGDYVVVARPNMPRTPLSDRSQGPRTPIKSMS